MSPGVLVLDCQHYWESPGCWFLTVNSTLLGVPRPLTVSTTWSPQGAGPWLSTLLGVLRVLALDCNCQHYWESSGGADPWLSTLLGVLRVLALDCQHYLESSGCWPLTANTTSSPQGADPWLSTLLGVLRVLALDCQHYWESSGCWPLTANATSSPQGADPWLSTLLVTGSPQGCWPLTHFNQSADPSLLLLPRITSGFSSVL